MMDRQPAVAEVVQVIKQILISDLQLRLLPDEIPDNCSLLDGGLSLDSVLIAELIARIEDHFRLEFDESVLEAALFSNLSGLAAFVVGECQASGCGDETNQPGGAPCLT